MRASIHTPERLRGETQEQYQDRRRASRNANDAARSGKTVHLSSKLGTYRDPYRTQRKGAIRAAGGMRQYRRALRNDAPPLA